MDEMSAKLRLAPASKMTPNTIRATVLFPCVIYGGTTLVAVIGVTLGQSLFRPGNDVWRKTQQAGPVEAFAAWDGQWYIQIAEIGYSYSPDRQSSVAFFPLYPLLGATLSRLTGLTVGLSLLVISHASLVGTFILASSYLRQRPGYESNSIKDWVLLVFGLFPTAFFLRMVYSESLFLFLVLIVMYGIERGWAAGWLSLLIGLATCTRVVGVAIIFPALFVLLRRCESTWAAARVTLWFIPASCWGILAYIGFQWVTFGDPWAFVHAHGSWRVHPQTSWEEKLIDLLALQPVWSRFQPSSHYYWRSKDMPLPLIINYVAAEPLLFLLTVALLITGKMKGWLSTTELLLGGLLLLIPYVGRAHEMVMTGSGRFALICFPVYMVLGQILDRVRLAWAILFLALCATWQGCFAALFSTWYRVF